MTDLHQRLADVPRKIGRGEMTINQARAEFGLPPLDYGDTRYMRLDLNGRPQMMPLPEIESPPHQ